MHKITRISMLLALSITLGILESFLELPIPGIKLGLANIPILIALYIYGVKESIFLSLLKVLFISLIRTGFNITFLFSLSGALLSIIMMIIFKKISNLSIIGISVIGSIFHIIGQIFVSLLILKIDLIYFVPLILIGTITGIIIGYISNETIKVLNFT